MEGAHGMMDMYEVCIFREMYIQLRRAFLKMTSDLGLEE